MALSSGLWRNWAPAQRAKLALGMRMGVGGKEPGAGETTPWLVTACGNFRAGLRGRGDVSSSFSGRKTLNGRLVLKCC